MVELVPSVGLVALVGEVHGRLVDGEAEHPVRVCRDVGEGDRSATGVSVEVEPVEACLVGGAVEAVDLDGDRIVLGRRNVPVHLEILQHTPHIGKLGKQRGVPALGGCDDPWQEQDVGHGSTIGKMAGPVGCAFYAVAAGAWVTALRPSTVWAHSRCRISYLTAIITVFAWIRADALRLATHRP